MCDCFPISCLSSHIQHIRFDPLCQGHSHGCVFRNQLNDLSPELVKFYRSAAGDPEDRVTNVRKVRRHYDFVVIGDSSSERMEGFEHSDSINIGCLGIRDDVNLYRRGLCRGSCGQQAVRSIRSISKPISLLNYTLPK